MQGEALLGKLGVRISLRRLVTLLVAYMIAHLCYEYYWHYGNVVPHAPHEYSYIMFGLLAPCSPAPWPSRRSTTLHLGHEDAR